MTELFLWIIATISITIWQIVLAVKLIGVKRKQNIQTIQQIETPAPKPIITKIKTPGVVDVDISKNLKIGSVDNSLVKSDETIKGKVKTQKDKLKKLRNV